VRIGYLIDTQVAGIGRSPERIGPAMEAMLAEGVLAEQAGFHSVHVPDRHGIGATVFPAPEQLLTLLAHETQRVMLGTFTWVGTLVHPMKALEQFAVIDRLSGGRLVTTVSRGFLPQFWGQFGVPEGRMLGRFQDALRVWRTAMGGESFDHASDFWPVTGGRLAPTPEQPGGWPIWGGGNQAVAAIERTPRYAAAWTTDPMPTTREAFTANADRYRAAARERGKVPFVVGMRDGWIADTEEEARAVFGPHYDRMAGFYAANDHVTTAGAQSAALIGTPEQCLEQLVHLHEDWGIDYVVLCCRLSTGPGFSAAAEQIQRLGEEVVRPLHERYPAPDHPAIPQACRW
jgi:alkanesulfonate monooxygenase SsuD/methylene tetrahydromethanopterin reductase-like flavin-dependent oxidoreductase (luciferase family)